MAKRNSSEQWIFPSNEYLSAIAFKAKKRFDFGSVELDIESKNNVLVNIKISGDFFGTKEIDELEKELVGVSLNKISEKISDLNISDYILGMTREEFTELICK